MSAIKKKLMFIIPSLSGGGAEKVLVDIISNLDSENYKIVLVLFNAEGIFMDKIPSNVDIFDLKKKSKFSFINLVYS